MSEKNACSSAPRSRVPEEAIVPQLNLPGLEFPRAPHITAESTQRAEARMKEVAGRIRGGSKTDLRQLAHPKVGTTGRGQLPQEPGSCWLPANRFNWFNAEPPATGVITGDLTTVLHEEFCSPVSSIVGGTSSGLNEAEARRFVSWANIPEGRSPNSGNFGFSVRTTRPASIPIISTVRIFRGPQDVPEKVLVNGGEERFRLGPGQRPSLFIDFLVPQRAVALEFGYIGSEAFIDQSDARLIAYDRDGNMLIESDAEAIEQQAITARNLVIVGVRHRQGAIATVELRFRDAENDSVAIHIVSRIWHEALPPAAVQQGTISTEEGRGAFAPPPPPGIIQLPPLIEIPFPGRPYPIGSETVHLPFRCDRAIVMLRGFKLEFLDQQPHEIRKIAVNINPRRQNQATGTVPGVFEVERGGSIILEAEGSIESGDRGEFGSRLLLYYTLVAWDSEQMDLVTAQGQMTQSVLQDAVVPGSVRVPDPCSLPAAERVNRDLNAVCGPLVGAPQGFEFRMPEKQEVEFVRLAFGATGGEHTTNDFDEQVMEIPHLDRRSNDIDWQVSSYIEGGDTYLRQVRGTVLSGPSLRLESGNPYVNFTFLDVGRRPSPSPDPTNEDHFIHGRGPAIAAIEGDLGFVGLSGFSFEPAGPIREMEIEVKGKNYDGQHLEFLVATGLSTIPPIGNSSEAHAVFVFPRFGALARKIRPARLELQDVEFSGHGGLISLVPTQFGVVRNAGHLPALIFDAQQSGPQADEFMFRFEHRGQILTLHDLQTRGPLVLAPGESLLVGGSFFTAVGTGPSDPPRLAFLQFHTNVASSLTVALTARGRTTPEDVEGYVLPESLDFHQVRIAEVYDVVRRVVVYSVGRSPLLIRAIALLDANAGFSWGVVQGDRPSGQFSTTDARYQVDPGGALWLQISFPTRGLPGQVIPQFTGVRQTSLILETNIGIRRVELRAEGII